MLAPATLEEVVGMLFPKDEVESRELIPFEWDPELEVAPVELMKTFRRINSGKAPGPDGLP